MNDQATTLRQMVSYPPTGPFAMKNGIAQELPLDTQRQTRTIAITGGKGGVGKSNVAVNLSLELGALGRKVSLLDADLGLANADVLLGLNPKFHLGHVLTGQRSLEEIVIELDGGVRLIPGGSGVEQLANLSHSTHSRCVAELRAMETRSDFMIIDTAAGIAGNVTGVLRAATEVVVVTTPDPTAVVDAYATIKVLHQHSPQKLVWVVVNNAIGSGDAQQVFDQLSKATERFLLRPIGLLGIIPHDSELEIAVRERIPVVEHARNAPSSRAIRLIAKFLDQHAPASSELSSQSYSFWKNLSETEV